MELLKTEEEVAKAIESDEMVLLYFGTESCGVCIDVKPKLKELLEKYPKIKAYNIRADENIKLSAKYNIFTIPGIIMYANEKEVIREARYFSMIDIDEKISRYYDMLFN